MSKHNEKAKEEQAVWHEQGILASKLGEGDVFIESNNVAFGYWVDQYHQSDYAKLAKLIYKEGHKSNPRGAETREILNFCISNFNPRDRIVCLPKRKLNIGFAIAEWVSTIVGDDRVDFLTPYIGRYGDYSSDGVHVDGAYGARICSVGQSQLSGVIEKLKTDESSRQAVISIYDGNLDLFGKGGVNTPCTLTLHFLIRNNMLHMIVNMRSNDVYFGFPYDFFNFSMIQELVTRILGVNLGVYIHNAASMHLYSSNYDLAIDIENVEKRLSMFDMPKNTSLDDVKFLHEALRELEDYEALVFADVEATSLKMISKSKQYFVELYLACAAMIFITKKKNKEQAMNCIDHIVSLALQKVLLNWV